MSDTESKSGDAGDTLRLLCPQWQGAGTSSVRALAPEFPFEVARHGYAVGSAVLEAILPAHDGATAMVPISMGGGGLEQVDGVEAKTVLVEQLARALAVIERHGPARIATSAASVLSASPRSPRSPAGTGTTWRSSGSTRTRTSARRPASTRASTPWPSPH